ncbi:hypothetical protein IWX46DRAFT_167342 [Phyllosticta citricarpa]|uniref:Uncharacterized protein n=1 Tax=Phyllosticta citricarpa TaxID=55181 RepID=A0ABR1M7T9_9PEZI
MAAGRQAHETATHAKANTRRCLGWRVEGRGRAERSQRAKRPAKTKRPPPPSPQQKQKQIKWPAVNAKHAKESKQASRQAGKQASRQASSIEQPEHSANQPATQHNRKGRVPSLYLPSRQGTRRPFREPQTRAVANVPALTPARHLGPRKGATTARLASRHTCNQWTPAPRPDSSAMLSKALISVNMSLLCTCLPFGLRLRCVALRLHLHALACRRSLSLSPSLSLLFPLSRSPQGSPWPRPQILFLFFFFFFFACAFVWAA